MHNKNNAVKEMMLSIGNELDEFKHEYDRLKDDKLDEDNEYLRYGNGKLSDENEKLCKGHKALIIKVNKVRKELEESKHVGEICDDECTKDLEGLRIENKILKSNLEDAKKIIAKYLIEKRT